jgi:hypothetical protein
MLQLYPLARQVKWRRVQEWYQASYTQRQTYRLVRFTTAGEVAATGQDMALSALSLPIKCTPATYYPTRTICRAVEITNTQTRALPTKWLPARRPPAAPSRLLLTGGLFLRSGLQ